MSETATIEAVATAVHDLSTAVIDMRSDMVTRDEAVRLAESAAARQVPPGTPRAGISAEDTGGVPIKARPEDLLSRNQSLASWALAHGQVGKRTVGAGGDDEFRLGFLLAAAAGGSREGLTRIEATALEGGIGEAGGFMLDPVVSAQLIDRARNASRVVQAGAKTLAMESGEVYIPRLDTGVSGVWRAEGVTISPETPGFGRITLRARTCAVLVVISQELLDDLSPQGLALIQNELTQALALKLDYAALRGAGAESEPLGIANTTGVASEELGAAGAVPADYDWALDAIGDVEGANGEPTAAIYSARTATTLRKLKTGLSGDKTPLQMPARVAQLNHLVSNQVPNDLVYGGSAAVCSEAYVGDFSQVIIGTRLGMRLRILNELYADTLQIGLQAFLRADVAIAHPDHLCIVHGFKES